MTALNRAYRCLSRAVIETALTDHKKDLYKNDTEVFFNGAWFEYLALIGGINSAEIRRDLERGKPSR